MDRTPQRTHDIGSIVIQSFFAVVFVIVGVGALVTVHVGWGSIGCIASGVYVIRMALRYVFAAKWGNKDLLFMVAGTVAGFTSLMLLMYS